MPDVIESGNLISCILWSSFHFKERVESEQWERIPVQVITEIEDLGKTLARGQFLIPRSVVILRSDEIVDPVVKTGAGGVAAGQQRQNGPGGLRRCARGGDEARVSVALAAFTPAAIEILDRTHPFQ